MAWLPSRTSWLKTVQKPSHDGTSRTLPQCRGCTLVQGQGLARGTARRGANRGFSRLYPLNFVAPVGAALAAGFQCDGQRAVHAFQFGQSLLHIREATRNKRRDFIARRLVRVGQREHFPDIFQTKSGGLGSPNKFQTLGGAARVGAIVCAGARVWLQQAFALVESNRRGGNAGGPGQLANRHLVFHCRRDFRAIVRESKGN